MSIHQHDRDTCEDGMDCPRCWPDGNPGNPVSGSVRYKDRDGSWVVQSPGSPYYSTAIMVTEQFWNGTEWESVN